jgi:hypothetical protein
MESQEGSIRLQGEWAEIQALHCNILLRKVLKMIDKLTKLKVTMLESLFRYEPVVSIAFKARPQEILKVGSPNHFLKQSLRDFSIWMQVRLTLMCFNWEDLSLPQTSSKWLMSWEVWLNAVDP